MPPAADPTPPLILELDPPLGTMVRVVSDLHLSHERCEAPSVQELASLLEGVGILVVAGDLSETREGCWQEEGLARREELRQLCQQRGVELICLAGNHDPDAGPQLLTLWGGRVVVMHGHALFKEGSPWGWEYLYNRQMFEECIARYPDCDTSLESRLQLARHISQLTPPIMRREGIRNRYLRGLLHCFFPVQRPWRIVSSWLSCGRKAEEFMRRFLPRAEVVVFGHFHRSGRWRYRNRELVNTGAWFKHATPWLADLHNGRLLTYRKVQ